jgi:hypothetical protein
MALRFERYGRFWAVYESDELLCVAVYRKGARAVIDRIERGTRERRHSRKKKLEPRGPITEKAEQNRGVRG